MNTPKKEKRHYEVTYSYAIEDRAYRNTKLIHCLSVDII